MLKIQKKQWPHFVWLMWISFVTADVCVMYRGLKMTSSTLFGYRLNWKKRDQKWTTVTSCVHPAHLKGAMIILHPVKQTRHNIFSALCNIVNRKCHWWNLNWQFQVTITNQISVVVQKLHRSRYHACSSYPGCCKTLCKELSVRNIE